MLSSPFVPCTPYMNLVLPNLGMLARFVVWRFLYFTLSVLWFLPHRSVKVNKLNYRSCSQTRSHMSLFLCLFLLFLSFCPSRLFLYKFCLLYLVSFTNFSLLNSKTPAKARSKSAAPQPRRKNTAHYESSSLSW